MLNDQTTASAAPAQSTDPDAAVENEAAAAQDAASAEQLEQLLVLSQAPLTLDAALEQEQEQGVDAGAGANPAQLTVGGLMASYVRLLGQVLGVGLITAAVRHYSTSPALYLGIGFGGALLFAFASTQWHAAGDGLVGRIRYVATSVLLGLGLGLLVGGVLHFSAFPHTAAVLVPAGLALSIGALVARDGRTLIGRDLISAGVLIAGLLVWVSVGLGLGAKKVDPPAANGGTPGAAAGDHGAAPAAADHGAAATAEHGETAAKPDHAAAATAGHGEAAAKTDHGAAATAEHGETAAKTDAAASTADHGETAAKTDHAAASTADHGAAAAKTDHAAASTAEHGTTAKTADTSHAATKSTDAAKEDEVTAADVLVPRKAH